MPTAILIGFEYTVNPLVGTIIDLYHAISWCSSSGCDIHLFTDITKIDASIIQQAVDHKMAHPDILTFYDRIESKLIVRAARSLQEGIARVLSLGVPDNKVIIYYSGHGVKDCMVMPDHSVLPFIDFRDDILNSLNPYVELFWILDCCNPNGLHLPYRLSHNSFTLSNSKIVCVTQPIILITSSESSEKSIATRFGSIFTYHLFRLLYRLEEPPIITDGIIPIQRNRNLRRLIGNLASSIRRIHSGYAQTVSIYSSYVIDPVLWMWIGSSKSYDLVVDMTLSVFVVRPRFIEDQSLKEEEKEKEKEEEKERNKERNKEKEMINWEDVKDHSPSSAGGKSPFVSLYRGIKF